MTLVSPAPDLDDEIIVTGCPFELLAQGPQLADLHVRVARAAQKIHADSKPMELLMADPTLDTTVLTRLGFLLATPPYGAHATVRRLSQAWTRHHFYTAMLAQFLRDVDQHMLASGAANPDKTITQTLTAGDVIGLWKQARNENFRYSYGYGTPVQQPHEADIPIHVALVLHALGGPSWDIDPFGMVASRILPGHPLRNMRGGMRPQRVSLPSKALVEILAWVMLPARLTGNGKDELLYAAAVGGQKKLRALWAAILDGKRHEFKMPKAKLEPSLAFGIGSATNPDVVSMRRVEGSGQYAAFWNDTPLATSGLAHLVLEHISASQPTDNQPFLHVTGEDGLPDLPHFFRQLDTACPLPLDAAWTQALWDKGVQAQLIRQLPSSGCAGYWVAAEDLSTWANIVSAIVSGDDTAEATMEAFGGAVADDSTPQLAQVINDYADDDQAND